MSRCLILYVSVVDEDRSCTVTAAVGSTAFLSMLPKTHQNNRGDCCGSRANPWVVEAQIGQQINVSLLDFGQQRLTSRSDDDFRAQSSATNKNGQKPDSCGIQYGYIVEKTATAGTGRNVSICSGQGDLQRNRFVYQSKGSTVEIVFSSSNYTSDKFLLGFEGYTPFNIISVRHHIVMPITACKIKS